MIRLPRHVIVASLAAFCGLAPDAAAVEVPDPSIERYHGALLKRPSAGYLFDRFYNTWLDHGDADTLIAYLRERVAEPGDDAADHLLLAFCLAKRGEEAEALATIAAAVEADPDNPMLHFHKARLEARTLAFDRAIADLERALAAGAGGEEAVRIRKLLGRLQARTGAGEAAAATWQALIAAAPDDLELREDLIEIQLQEGLYDAALATSEALIEATADPYQQVVRGMRRADILERSGERERALAAYAELLPRTGGGSWLEKELLAQIERIYRREDDIAGLRERFDALREAEPQRVAVLERAARIAADHGDLEAAIAGFEAIIAITPGDRRVREAFVGLLRQHDRLDLAQAQLESLLEQHPEDEELLIQLAELHHQQGDREAELAVVERYHALVADTEYGVLRAARLMERAGDPAAAEAAYRAHLADRPEADLVTEALADHLIAHDRREEAYLLLEDLAADGGTEAVARVVRSLRDQDAPSRALNVIEQAEARLGSDEPVLLDLRVDILRVLDRPAEALPAARERLRLATAPGELQQAVAQVVTLAEELEQAETLRVELAAAEALPVTERVLLAELRKRIGDTPGATAALSTDGIEAPADLRLLLNARIHHATAEDDVARAIAAAEALVAVPGERRAGNLERLVDLNRRLPDLDAALRWVGAWKEAAPGSTRPWLVESAIHLEAFEGDEAVATLRRAAARFPDEADLRAGLAETYQRAGQLAEAERAYWQLYEQSEELGTRLGWVTRLAQVAEEQGTTAALIEAFEERRRDNRESIVPLLALAEIHRVAMHPEERRQALLAATRLKPDDVGLLVAIARIEEEEGDWERAIQTLQRAREIDDSPEVRRALVGLYIGAGMQEEALALIGSLAAGGGNPDAEAVLQVAGGMIANGEWELADRYLDEQLAQFPDAARAHYLAAVIDEFLGHERRAAEGFLALLDWQHPITAPGASSATPAFSVSQWTRAMRGTVPGSALDLMIHSEQASGAYSHLEQHHRHMARPGTLGGGVNPVTLPRDREQLQALSLAHLGRLIEAADAMRAAELHERVLAGPVPDAALRMRLTDMNGMDETVPDLAAEHPEDAAVQALAVIMGTFQGGSTAEQAARRFAMFEADYPTLAAMSVLSCSAVTDTELIEEAIAAAEGVEHPTEFGTMGLLGPIAGQFNASGPTLSEEQERRVADLAVNWYRQAEAGTSPWAPWLFQMVLATLLEAERIETLARLLEEELEKQRSNAGPGAQMMGMWGHNQNTLIRGLAMPPRELASVPPLIRNFFDPDGRQMRMVEIESLADLEPELIRAAIAATEHPILRLLWARVLPDDARFEEEALPETTSFEALLGELMAADEPILDAYLFAAAHAADRGAPARAVQLLETARHLPMTRSLRQSVDAAIVHYALETGADGEAESEEAQALADAGADAALRLRRSAQNSEQQIELATALDQLGRGDEAEALTQAAQRQPSQPSAQALAMRHGGGGSGITGQAQGLLDRDRDDAAERLISRHLRLWARDAWTGQIGTHRHQSDEVREFLDQHDELRAAVIAALGPDEGPIRKRAERARSLQLIGATDAAIAAYRAILAEDPDQHRLRALVIPLVAAEGADLGELVAAIDPEGFADFASVVQSQSDDQAQLLDLLDGVAAWCESHPTAVTDATTPLNWSMGLLERIIDQGNFADNEYRPDLYSREGLDSDHRIDRRRRTVHDRLCRALLPHPAAGHAALSRLLFVAEHAPLEEVRGDADDSEQALGAAPTATTDTYRDLPQALLDRALPRVLDFEHEQLAGRMTVTHYAMGFSDDGEQAGRLRGALEYAVAVAHHRGEIAELETRLVAALREAGRAVEADVAAAIIACYRVAPADYPEAAVALLEHQTGPAVPTLGENPDYAELVLAIWRERELEVDLGDALLAGLDQPTPHQSPWDGSAMAPLVAWTRELLATEGGRSAALAFADRVAEAVAGPLDTLPERTAALIERTNGQVWNAGEDGEGILHFFHYFNGLLREPALLFDAYARLERNRLLEESDNNWFQHQTGQATQKAFSSDDAAAMVALLESSPWLGGVAEWHDHPLRWGRGDSFFEEFAHQVGNDERMRQIIGSFLDQEEPGFGRDLLLAAITERRQRTNALLRVLGSYRDELEAMPEATRAQLTEAVREFVHSPERSTTNSDATIAAGATWLVGVREAELEIDEEAFLAAATLDSLGIDDDSFNEYDERIEALLADKLDDPARATALLVKAAELRDTGFRGHSISYGGERTWASQLLAQILEDEDDPHLALDFAWYLLGSDELEIPLGDSNLRYRLARHFESALERTGRLVDEPIAAFAAVLGRLADAAPERSLADLTPILFATGQRLDDREQHPLIRAGAALDPAADPVTRLTWFAAGGAALDELGESDTPPEVDAASSELLDGLEAALTAEAQPGEDLAAQRSMILREIGDDAHWPHLGGRQALAELAVAMLTDAGSDGPELQAIGDLGRLILASGAKLDAEQAKALARAVDRHLAQYDRHHGSYDPFQHQPAPAAIALALQLAADDGGAWRRMARRSEQLGATTVSWAILARAGEIETLAELVGDYDPETPFSDRGQDELYYDEAVATGVAALGEAVADPDRLLFARVAIGRLPGPDRESRDERLRSLAEALLDRGSSALRDQAIGLLADESAARALLADELARIASETDFVELLAESDDQEELDGQLREWRRSVRAMLEAGRTQRVRDLVAELLQLTDPERAVTWEPLEELTRALDGAADETDYRSWTAEQFDALRDCLRASAELPAVADDVPHYHNLAHLVVLAVARDTLDGHREWFEALSEEQRTRLADVDVHWHSLRDTFEQLLADGSPLAADREAAAQRLLTTEDRWLGHALDAKNLRELLSKGLVPETAVLAQPAAVLAAHPQTRGWFVQQADRRAAAGEHATAIALVTATRDASTRPFHRAADELRLAAWRAAADGETTPAEAAAVLGDDWAAHEADEQRRLQRLWARLTGRVEADEADETDETDEADDRRGAVPLHNQQLRAELVRKLREQLGEADAERVIRELDSQLAGEVVEIEAPSVVEIEIDPAELAAIEAEVTTELEIIEVEETEPASQADDRSEAEGTARP